MPTTPTALNHAVTKIMRGVPLEVWIDVAPNTDGTITLDLATGRPDTTANPLAKNVGFTQDGAELTRGVTTEDLPVDQTQQGILQSITGQDVHLKTGLLQIRDYVNMARLFPGMAVMTGTGFSGISDQLVQVISLIPVCAIAPTPNDATKWQVLIVYAGYNIAPYSAKLAKQYHKLPIDIKAQDAGRVDGRTFSAYETTA